MAVPWCPSGAGCHEIIPDHIIKRTVEHAPHIVQQHPRADVEAARQVDLIDPFEARRRTGAAWIRERRDDAIAGRPAISFSASASKRAASLMSPVRCMRRVGCNRSASGLLQCDVLVLWKWMGQCHCSQHADDRRIGQRVDTSKRDIQVRQATHEQLLRQCQNCSYARQRWKQQVRHARSVLSVLESGDVI